MQIAPASRWLGNYSNSDVEKIALASFVRRILDMWDFFSYEHAIRQLHFHICWKYFELIFEAALIKK